MVPQPKQQQHIRGIPTTAFAGSAGGMDADEQCLDEQLFLPSQQQLPLPLQLQLQQQSLPTLVACQKLFVKGTQQHNKLHNLK